MPFRNVILFAAAALLVAPSPASAGNLAVRGAWFRLLPAGLPAAGYFKLQNQSGKAAVLTGAETAACGTTMLHKTEHMGGMDQMSMVDSVEIGAGETFEFRPGGFHLMCMNPALKTGTAVSVTLHFADGSSLKAMFEVRGATGK